MWKRDQQHGNVWLKAHLTIPKSDNIPNYRLAFEATVGKGYKGDVAIDEIIFTANRRCSPVSEFGESVSHYCDFESNDLCSYRIENSTAIWKRSKAGNSPDYDNTYQTKDGYFMQLKVMNFI